MQFANWRHAAPYPTRRIRTGRPIPAGARRRGHPTPSTQEPFFAVWTSPLMRGPKAHFAPNLHRNGRADFRRRGSWPSALPPRPHRLLEVMRETPSRSIVVPALVEHAPTSRGTKPLVFSAAPSPFWAGEPSLALLFFLFLPPFFLSSHPSSAFLPRGGRQLLSKPLWGRRLPKAQPFPSRSGGRRSSTRWPRRAPCNRRSSPGTGDAD